jgi:hypothetical protein
MGLNDTKEIIKAERETCKFYLKIDFGLLAGTISIITILNLKQIDIFRMIGEIKIFIVSIIVLICCGLLFDYWLLIKWSLQNLTENQQKSVLTKSMFWIGAQSILHILFILNIASAVIGYSGGFNIGYSKANAMISIVSNIENYNKEKGDFPKTLEDLTSRYPLILDDINQLGKNKLSYTLDKNKGYLLHFAGQDGKLETKDDVIENHDSFLGKTNLK